MGTLGANRTEDLLVARNEIVSSFNVFLLYFYCLIDWIVFNIVLAIFQPYNGGILLNFTYSFNISLAIIFTFTLFLGSELSWTVIGLILTAVVLFLVIVVLLVIIVNK